ncbi:hypothetical protein PHMEG_00012942 [Phytophthora megakarya]|uniref:Uncharacterized protein n=1 Tax=Phytophthora megakarya TaxID=4795 RepID=A0A225WA43_9STRA|nr:hypothetical protein PHMEG_00012942 [Phytophthora megakarya]
MFPVFYDAQVYSKTIISLPRTPGVGSTIYKVQGETLHFMVVVDWKAPVAIVNKPQQTYLLVSRFVSRFAFSTLAPLTPDLIAWSCPPPVALLEEIRLKELSSQTLKRIHQDLLLC